MSGEVQIFQENILLKLSSLANLQATANQDLASFVSVLPLAASLHVVLYGQS
jgi:hypothetical protein